ncbi:MAG TPA: MoxR family ATPase [Myxococcales bacterium]|jgi:MoxR-like ATPase|nr:MoxR family ATPase [Myxococcales bacterium]
MMLDDGAPAKVTPIGAPLTAQEARRVASAMETNISRALKGKQEIVELALAALAAGGHLLLEDVPGVGKTTLAQALARSLDLSFARVQFTSDLLPGDITGVSIYDQARNNFVFKPGPLFANLVLADEINRTTPRTQSCLLEAMSEGQVSVDGVARPLPGPFMVLATQNPHEHAGTYPLPESQLDRFLLRLSVGYPAREVERELLLGGGTHTALTHLHPVASAQEVRRLQAAVPQVTAAPEIADYVLAIVAATRNTPLITLGASPRGAIALLGVAKARALLRGRTYVEPDDVKELCVPALAHRITLQGRGPGGGELERLAAERVVRDLVEQVPVPE